MTSEQPDRRNETIGQGNARAVVETWRTRGELLLSSWRPPALDMLPSRTTRLTAQAWGTIAKTIDAQADALLSAGFSAGHAVIREMRGMASNAAHRQQAAVAWAADLQWAEEATSGDH